MPHHTSITSVDWKSVCEPLGIEYIDPTADICSSLQKIQASDVVIAEAMHAAIVADALRVPWVPVNLHGGYINSFKWNDWCGSLGLEYKPYTLGFGKSGRLIKRDLPLITKQTVQKMVNYPLARRVFKKIIKIGLPTLSSNSSIESTTTRLLEKMDKLSDDFDSGDFG